jgi:hypothetical protein
VALETAAAKLMYINYQFYQFFIWGLGLNDFDGGKSILRAIEKEGWTDPENQYLFGPCNVNE